MVYHHVGDTKADPKSIANGIWYVPIKTFEDEMQFLSENGYPTISLIDYVNAYKGASPDSALQPRSIALTFDDGYDDAYTIVYPILHRYGLMGTFFIITGRVGQKGYLTWDQIKEMQAGGMEFGAHTITHPFMTTLSYERAFAEMIGSKLALEAELNTPITTFAFPYNDHNTILMEMARLVGYSSAYIVDYHEGDPKDYVFGIPRITVGSGESLSVFQYAVNRAYRPR
jgi:peptidoglycan/xylan/chitin deacetylase (PgdA/CDA1 family)